MPNQLLDLSSATGLSEGEDVRRGFARNCDPRNATTWEKLGPELPESVSDLFEHLYKQCFKIGDDAYGLIGQNTPWYIKPPLFIATQIIGLVMFFFGLGTLAIVPLFPVPKSCDTPRTRKAQLLMTWANLATRWLPIIPESFAATVKMEANFACPTDMSSTATMIEAWAKGYLSDKECEVWTMASGLCPGWRELEKELASRDFSLPEVMKLWNSKVISNDDLPKYLRKVGVVDAKMIPGYKFLYENVPGLSQVFDGMRRDLLSADVVNFLGVDEDFDARYTGQFKTWGDRNGYTNKGLRYLWRLGAQTIDPKLITRMFKSGKADAAMVEKLYRYNGYTSKAAKLMAETTSALSGPQAAAAQGLPTLRELEAAFLANAIGENDYYDMLKKSGVPDEQRTARVGTAKLRKKMATVKGGLSMLRRAYLQGRLSDHEAELAVRELGVEQTASDDIRSAWRNAKKYSNKQLAAEKLCGLYAAGLLTIEDYQKRMVNLNYNEVDATMLVTKCLVRTQDALQAKLEKEQAAALRDAKSRVSEAKKRAKELKAEAEARLPCRPAPKPRCDQLTNGQAATVAG